MVKYHLYESLFNIGDSCRDVELCDMANWIPHMLQPPITRTYNLERGFIECRAIFYRLVWCGSRYLETVLPLLHN